MMNIKKIIIPVFILFLMNVFVPCITDYQNTLAAEDPNQLKIGLVVNLGWPLGLDFSRGADIMEDVINKRGGLDVGGKKYIIDLITYDSKASNETAQAAVERLISVDKVKFIMGDDTSIAWNTTAEANKVLTIACTPSPNTYNPKFKYVFQGMVGGDTNAPQVWGRFMKDHPDMKTCVIVAPDNEPGHVYGGQAAELAATYGPKLIEPVWYPFEATDLSAVGTKIKRLNPDVLVALGGGPIQDNLVYKSAYQAGWKGQMFTYGSTAAEVLTQVLPAEVAEGMILAAYAVELNNPPPTAKEFKEAYIAKNGEWNGPEIVQLNAWYMLLAAIQQAGTITDTDAVAAVLGNGMKYSSVCSEDCIMIPRPDLGINKTVDTIGGMYLKQIVNGKKKIIAEIGTEEAFEYNKQYYGWK